MVDKLYSIRAEPWEDADAPLKSDRVVMNARISQRVLKALQISAALAGKPQNNLIEQAVLVWLKAVGSENVLQMAGDTEGKFYKKFIEPIDFD